MKFATIITAPGVEQVGCVVGRAVYPLATLGRETEDMISFIETYTPETGAEIESLAKRSNSGIPLERAVFTAPIPRPRHDMLCIGQNYLEHALESARYKGTEYVKPSHPMYFSKRIGLPVGHGGGIPAHADVTSMLDYEAELAVVIGKRCDHVAEEDVSSHIFGYTIVNDVSARDRQNAHGQYMFGKSLDGFAPMGPWIVTRDEFVEPVCVQVMSRVNGEVRQNANTSEFIFPVSRLLGELSSGMVLEAGDIFITGTPSGVGMGFVPPKYLKSGDVVECEIEGIGVLRNSVL